MKRKSVAKVLKSVIVLISVAFFTAGAYAQGLDNRANSAHAQVSLPVHAHGIAAIEALSDKLPEVALLHRMSTERLEQLLMTDHTLRVDTSGRLLYVEEFIGFEEKAEPLAAEANAPLEDTFYLHSSPQSTKVIYLDFNGHTIPSNSAWANG